MNGGNEASPKQRLNSYQTRPLPLEVSLDKIFEELVKEMLVVKTDQPILEDS